MVLLFDDDVYSSDMCGGRLLAKQAAKAKTSVQVASFDGSSPSWIPLEPCLLLVSRGRAIRLAGEELNMLIAACEEDGDFVVGHPQTKG